MLIDNYLAALQTFAEASRHPLVNPDTYRHLESLGEASADSSAALRCALGSVLQVLPGDIKLSRPGLYVPLAALVQHHPALHRVCRRKRGTNMAYLRFDQVEHLLLDTGDETGYTD